MKESTDEIQRIYQKQIKGEVKNKAIIPKEIRGKYSFTTWGCRKMNLMKQKRR